MSYIGQTPPALGTYAPQTFSGNGVLTAFTLNQASTTATILVAIDGVDQIPTTAYSVASTTLTFTAPPPNGTTISVRFMGNVVDFGTPSDASVAVAHLATTGTASASTVLKGDMSWGTVEGSVITTQNNFFKNWNAVTSTQTTTVASTENAAIIGEITVNSGVTWTIDGTLTLL